MTIVRTSAKGQVVIPSNIREAVGLEPGQMVAVRQGSGNTIVVEPLTDDPVNDLFGSCKAAKPLTKDLARSRHQEQKREEQKGAGLMGAARVSPGRAKRRRRAGPAKGGAGRKG